MNGTMQAAADDEQLLVRRAQSGDNRAFGDLVERHMRRAYYAALGLVGSHEDALDLSQEAFVRAFRARTRLDPGRPFYSWLYQILRRLCFNFLRDRRTRRRKLREAGPWIAADAAARGAEAGPETSLRLAEERARLAAALDALRALDREVLVLREFEGLRYREIAALLDIPEGTVMSRLYAARRRLAAALEDER